MSRTDANSETPHARQQYTHKCLPKDVSGPETKEKKISIRNCGSTVKRQSPDWESDDDFAVPFIETLPAANLLFSGGTVGSCTLFIFAICRTFAITA